MVCSSHIPQVRYEEGCCPGQVIEKKYVTHKPVTETYTYQVPVYSKKCHQQSAGVDKQVIPRSYETAPVCETQETVVKIPTTDMEVQNQPLCKRTCTTSSYIIQIPITETTCTNSPLCKKTVRSQDNVLTTVSKKTSCAKQHCTQNTIVEKPVYETVCQDYQQSVDKVGTKTVLKPEVKKYCVQMKPYRCMKPVYDHGSSSGPVDVSASSYAGAYASSNLDNYSTAGAASYVDSDYSAAGAYQGSAPADFSAPSYVSAPSYISAPSYVSGPAHGSAPCNCAC